MVLTVGNSFEPLVLSIDYIQPQKEILFLYTKETKKSVSKIIKCLDLEFGDYQTEPIDNISTVQINGIIKKYYEKWKEEDPNGKIVIDFTGGTKVMSVGCGLAGALIDAKLTYVASVQENRINIPGSECIKLIKNPYEISGTVEYEKAVKLFEEYDYKGSAKVLENILSYTWGDESEKKYELLKLLSSAYYHWDEMQFGNALECMNDLISKLEILRSVESGKFFLYNKIQTLYAQKKILETLATVYKEVDDIVQKTDSVKNEPNTTAIKKTVANKIFGHIKNKDDEFSKRFLFSIYARIFRQNMQGKYDLAVLLLYRLLEFIVQRRLAVNGINPDNPDFKHFYTGDNKKFDDIAAFINALKAVSKKYYLDDIYNITSPRELNNREITMQNGFIILKTIEDDIFPGKPEDNNSNDSKINLLTIKNKIGIRNKNYLTHGYMVVNKNEYADFEEYITICLKRFCKIENINFNETKKSHTFLTPKDFISSKNPR